MALTQVQGGMIASSQTITSPTLTTPTITSPTINGTYTADTSLITSGTAVASTSGTSIDFTGIPSWVKRITVMFDGTSTNGSAIQMVQVGSGSVTTTGYKFYGNALQNGAGAGQTSTSGFLLDGGNAFFLYGSVILTLISTNKWLAVVNGGGWNSGGAYYRSYNGGGDISLSGALDRVRITTSNGTDTFNAGSINILYE